jgi:cysteinyl-tRNA synthetase, unknown class
VPVAIKGNSSVRLIVIFMLVLSGNCWAGEERPPLSDVRHWLLLLNNDLDDGTAGQIAASEHDMAVVDHVSSQLGVAEGRSAEVVRQLKLRADGGRRLVIAYLNVGQAESYRTYWKKGWRIGRPTWILGTDPDGWQDNYPVAYWAKAWKELIVGDGGLMASIQKAGFDGVYLDWIGGFEDSNVLAKAKRDGVDARAEMVAWVGEVSRAAKASDPGFLIIAQNAAPLLSLAAYLEAIDGVAHEDIWFTGADSGPQGDCPVPRTQNDVGSAAFIASLNKLCRRAFGRDKANAMHFVGEAAIVPMLQGAQAAGKTIFTVDYAVEGDNVKAIMSASRGNGFVPFAGARLLKDYVGPVR